MNVRVKIALYVGLVLWSSGFGWLAGSRYSRLMQGAPKSSEHLPSDVPAVKMKGVTQSSGYSQVLIYGAFFFVGAAALGILIGHDVSHFIGNKTIRMLYDEEGKIEASPDYEAAEQEWADGNFLEAVRLFREYLNHNPREQHVAIRIAEIYEKDLHNPLAAALEYEEILQQKLPPEKWSWSAIHLCNLYFRLNQTAKAADLLRRICTDHPGTAAAEKAGKRLDQMGLEVTAPAAVAEAEPASHIPPLEVATDENALKLPPGFQPKRRA